ncbi:MAG: Organic solvent tolerance protein OstA [Cyclobacteriaceae bacterium]|nr:Organic solvent tolerance protein OstA [Cyclobacteriaceae bacterium]
MRRSAIVFMVILCSIHAFGQRKVKLEKANSLRGSVENGVRMDWVIGDVVFVQNETTIYCDSAIFNKADNSVKAYGRIRITEGDSVTVTSNGLTYDGNKKIAYLRKNVVFTKLQTATLYTDFLDYDRPKNEARYFNRGKLVDSTNTLTSDKGYYDLRSNLASFKKNVVGVNKDYTMTSDTLQYSSKTKFIYFRAVTRLEDREGGVAFYENGFYDTKQKKSDLVQGVFETPSYKLQGTRLFLDNIKKLYRAQGKVIMTSKAENMNIHGDEGYYDRKTGISKVYGHAYVERITDDNDTLFISADTLVSIENADPKKKRLLAYYNVRIFKTDLQGKADSLVYVASDSILYFFRNPVLWTEENQMTADSIRILLEKKKISRIYMVSNSFVVSEDSLTNFNQIKGRNMTAFFEGKNIHHVIVKGNGESLYFALQEKEQEKEGKKEKYTITSGMNKIICSNMRINFKAGKVNNISFYINPDASFIPPHELKADQIKLKGFNWRGFDRPTRQQVVQQRPQ